MEFVIHNLSNALVEEGHKVTVIAERTAWSKIGVEHAYDLKRYGIPVSGIRRIEALYAAGSLWSVIRKHREKSFDVLHCHSVSRAGVRAVRAKRLLDIPLVMTPHGVDIQRVSEINYGLRLNERWNEIICNNMEQADAVTAISLSIQQELDCVDQSKIIRIPNGVHIEKYRHNESRDLRNRLGLSDDVLLVLSVGRNHIKKGYEYGIKAIHALRQTYGVNNVHYVIVGKSVSDHYSLVSQLSLESMVTLIEELDESGVVECYQSADIFFSPSIIEGLSLVSIEALASGLPLLVTDVPGNEDVVRDTGAGKIVRSKDPDHMASGLYELIKNAEMRDLLGNKAKERSASYDWSEVAKRYVNLYQRVIAHRSVIKSV